MQKLRLYPRKTKEKALKILHVDGGRTSERGPVPGENDAWSPIEHDPAFNTRMLDQQESVDAKVSITKVRETFRSIATAVVHPIDSVKSKATKTTAGKLSNTQRPYLSQEADLEFLNAHHDLYRTYSSRSLRRGTSNGEEDSLTNDRKGKVEEMEAHRESLRVAWITSRHVSRVRVVAKRQIKFPSISYFTKGEVPWHLIQSEWLKWLGHVRLLPWLTPGQHY